jgi:hypothetical protein
MLCLGSYSGKLIDNPAYVFVEFFSWKRKNHLLVSEFEQYNARIHSLQPNTIGKRTEDRKYKQISIFVCPRFRSLMFLKEINSDQDVL